MNDVELWIEHGNIVTRPTRADGSAFADRHLLHAMNMVKVEINSTGTTIHWVMFAANWTSLLYVIDLVPSCACPVTLRYFNSGWFEETISSAIDARHRLETLFSKSDIRLVERTYVVPFAPDSDLMSNNLRQILLSGSAPVDSSVLIRINVDAELASVEQVGINSPLAKIWGIAPVSYPCQTGHSYDRAVSRSYFTAVDTGRPVYDHVLAAMVKPNADVQWMNYQRLIIPENNLQNGESRVRVVVEVSPVDIHPL